jgi:hypothetical protein
MVGANMAILAGAQQVQPLKNAKLPAILQYWHASKITVHRALHTHRFTASFFKPGKGKGVGKAVSGFF